MCVWVWVRFNGVGASKSWMEGFYDPLDEGENELYIRYSSAAGTLNLYPYLTSCYFSVTESGTTLVLVCFWCVYVCLFLLLLDVACDRYRFLGFLHECVVGDLDEVCIPMEGKHPTCHAAICI